MLYAGALPEIQALVKSCNADKSTLTDWLAEYDRLQSQINEVERLEKTLPNEIEKLLRSGSMDDSVVEELARKRAFLDLLPARVEKLNQQMEELETAKFEAARALIEEVIRKAIPAYFSAQMKKAVADLMQLGADEDTAEKQALLRKDISLVSATACPSLFQEAPDQRVRTILWCYEAYEVGLHPRSPEAESIKKRWFPVK